MRVTIKGLQEAQQRNMRRVAMFRPNGKIAQAIKRLTTGTHRYAVGITHVDTGSLRASHRMEVSNDRGRIYISPSAVNPRSKQRPAVYGVYEHQRGGSHAFYKRAVDEYGARHAHDEARNLGRSLLYGS